MKRIRLIKNWDFPNIMRQTPLENGVWEDIQISENPESSCDYVLVLNHVTKDVVVTCPPEHIWCLTQEPPVPEYEWFRKGFKQFHRVYSQDVRSGMKHVIASAPANPWWVGKSYSELKAQAVPEKPHTLSWVMSSKASRSGHLARLAFLEQAKNRLLFDLWGRGFKPFDDKWDAIAPYQYSIALENESAPYYWTEKLSDVLLGWGLPIYYGAPNISAFLPSEAIIQIDIDQPEEAIQIIEEAIATNQWQKRLDAIAHARELILDKWQLFPYVKSLIDDFEKVGKVSSPTFHHLKTTYQIEPGFKSKVKRFLKGFLG